MSLTKEFKIVWRSPKDLIPYENNVKEHTPEQIAKLCEAIKRTKFDVPIVVDGDGVIIKGHGRRLAALELGLDQVPVIVRSDLTREQARLARLADNRVAISNIDGDMLRDELSDMDLGMDGIFDAKELEFLEADLGTMNIDAFVTDSMDSVLEKQKSDVEDRTDKVSAADVPLAKAFGFKTVAAASVLVISQLMARAEATTGLKGEFALVAWAENTIGEEVSAD